MTAVLDQVFVRDDGCIHLGPLLTCDGFSASAEYRVQTHVHHDHLTDFERSKGAQRNILCSRATYELLVAEFDADLPYRRSQFAVLDNLPACAEIDGLRITLYPSGHMPGGTIALAEYPNGLTCAYTSDFDWPLSSVPENVEVLVVDATYGDPCYQRRYDQSQVIEDLQAIFLEMIATGPVVITGYRGRLQFAYQLLSGVSKVPFFGSYQVAKTFSVYAQVQGLDEARLIALGRKETRELLKTGERAAVLVDFRDRDTLRSLQDLPKIVLSAYLVPRSQPILRHGAKRVRVALTDHADFMGTVELIQAVRPKFVIADSARGGNADALARYVREELGIPATAEKRPTMREWGR